ncbi:hypothetical protein K1719_035920 [Acacia pycnantha]|nr:hypothetical protein K1719_035920 [Acacia pycnantha]
MQTFLRELIALQISFADLYLFSFPPVIQPAGQHCRNCWKGFESCIDVMPFNFKQLVLLMSWYKQPGLKLEPYQIADQNCGSLPFSLELKSAVCLEPYQMGLIATSMKDQAICAQRLCELHQKRSYLSGFYP